MQPGIGRNQRGMTQGEKREAEEAQGFERKDQPQDVPEHTHLSIESAPPPVCPLRLLPENGHPIDMGTYTRADTIKPQLMFLVNPKPSKFKAARRSQLGTAFLKGASSKSRSFRAPSERFNNHKDGTDRSAQGNQ